MAEPASPEGRDGAVVLAYVHDNSVSYSWHHSMVELMGWDMTHQARVVRGGFIAYRGGTDALAAARNKVARTFLDEHMADWLLWVDTDMGFAPDTLDRLFEAADPDERPIVGGLAFGQKEEATDGMGGWRCRAVPVVMDWAVLDSGQMGFTVRWDYPPDQVVKCAGTGSACVLIHRSVFEKVAKEYGDHWYDRVPNPTMGQVTSEDLSLYLRCGALDIPVHVHTGVKTTHHKQVWVGEDDYFGQRILAQWSPPVPAADEPVAVVVPVLWRPGHAEPFMESFRASGAAVMGTVYAVADEDDEKTAAAWRDAGAVVITRNGPAPGSFPVKANIGYRETTEPWLFFAGDDNKFHPGWLDQAMHAARTAGADVAGTNDLHNPRVLAGDLATNWLIRRSYLDKQGGSWDGPGTFAHEGYRHWFVDEETVAVARQRGAYVYAPHAKVENCSPVWGESEADEVSKIGPDNAAADKALFEARLAKYGPAAKVAG